MGRKWKGLKGVQVTAALLASKVWIENGMLVLESVVVVGMVLALLVGCVCEDGTIVERRTDRSAVVGPL